MDSINIKKNHLCVGVILSPHGIRGAVKIKSFTDTPTDIILYGDIFNEDCSEKFSITIISDISKGNKAGVLISKIKGISNRDSADKLKHTKLYIDKSNLPKTNPDEFYIEDLIGMNLVDKNSNNIGTILAIHNFGAGDIAEIKLINAKDSEMIPFKKENFLNINIKLNTAVFIKN